MTRVLKRICMTAMAVLVMAFMYGGSAAAKGITVSGQDIQAALNDAKNAGEQVVVTIPAGTYNLNSSLVVYANTTIQAEGAEIIVHGAHPALTVSEFDDSTNIKVFGGTWRADEAEKVIDFHGRRASSQITLENMTVCGNKNARGIFINGLTDGKVSHCEVDGVAIGISLSWCEQIEVVGNTTTDSAETGFQAETVKKLTVSGNTFLRNGKFGIFVDWDEASVIEKNTLDGCALDPNRAGHGEGLVIQHGDGTLVQENHVYNVESHIKDWGNGILISFSKNIIVQSNVVENAGNHGLQATYGSENIQFNYNTVNNSGNVGISISRATTADITGGTITNTTGSAIVYDGRIYEGKTGVSGTVDGCMIDGSTAAGIYIEQANVTVKNATVKNSTKMGVAVLKNSTATLINNVIRQDNVDAAASGIVLNEGGKIELNGNRICNFGESGIVQNPGCTITGTNNQIMVNDSKFVKNAIFLQDTNRADKIQNNTLLIRSINDTEVIGQNYFAGFKSGAVVNGIEHTAESGDGGYFTVSYPQTDSSKVIVYVKDDANNAIILQASPDFDLNKLQPADTKLLEDFVRRMYRTTLGREPDAGGLDYYVTRLLSGELDGSAIAQRFVGSPEFEGKKLNADDYLAALYSAFYNRGAASHEIQYWKDKMTSGMSRKYVLSGFVNSNEFAKLCQDAGISRGQMVLAEGEEYEVDLEKLGDFVERLYVKALKRDAEPDGKQYWTEQISTRRVTAEEAAKKFFFSDEFKGFHTSNNEYVARLYETFMGRTAEPAGMDYWMNEMNRGMSREEVLSRFAASDEFKGIMRSFGIVQ